MSSCQLSTCPQSHRRPRDAMRQKWSDLVSEGSPVWAVLVDDRPAIVAPTREVLVVASAASGRPDHTIGLDQVSDVSAMRCVVHIMDRGGNHHDFTFVDGADAVRAAELIEQMRAAACERGAEEAAVGPDQQPKDLLARRSNGHPTIGSRVVRWADDTDLDDDSMDELDLPEPAPAQPDAEVHPRPGPDDEAGADAALGDDEAPADASDPGAGDAAATEVEHVGPAVEDAEDPAPDDHPAPRTVDDDRDGEPERPSPAPPQRPAADGDLEIGAYALDDGDEVWDQLPIEREVAMALAAGLPLVSIPAQAPPPSDESVLLVTTDTVPGRSVAVVHGDVLAVVSWPVAWRGGRSVHDAARARLAQAVLQRGGNAVIGLRYGSTGAVGGDVVAYGTAVTLKPPAEAAVPAEAGAAGEG